MIAAGAGAGLALPSLPGVLPRWLKILQDLSGLTLGTAILASFIGAVVCCWAVMPRTYNLDRSQSTFAD